MNEMMNVPDIFGSDVFNESTMRQRLAQPVFDAWKACIATGSQFTLEVANDIAEAMKQWALDMDKSSTA